jgi:type I restriction enzyme S subunit
MSGMNFLEKLLDGVAVEWKPLGKVGQVRMCKRILKSQTSSEGDIPFYKIGTFGKEPDAYISKKLFEEYKSKYSYPKIGEILISASGTIGRTVMFDGEDSYFQDSNIIWIENDESVVLNKFLFYFYQIANWGISVGGTIQRLYNDNLRKLSIPIPCPDNPDRSLAIQAEIVRILDTFTALTAELTAELSDRKKQYNYYRDRLLTFEKSEVEWKTLGEVALDFGRGKSKHRPRNDPKLYGGNTPFIQTGDIRNASHIIETYSQTYSEIGLKQSKLWSKGTLCITIAANIAETSILGFDACFPDSVIGFVANPEKTTSGYVEYLLSSLKTKLEEMGQGSAQSNINMGTFENLRLPFPPLAEQVRIASLLDKFDTLTHSISEGLPREIALRQKQYEYYRDLLLSFPPPLTLP